ncbi:two-component system sensor histidine kinase PmrB [Pseudoalteromonas sp. A25]|uniref:ATP-binding protein n=1 Tax=Pseudoalteromonas sp. A25 TaxID=116092 RepID=UPI0012A0E0B1|nr:ATP-binding protein [Pseudoalteromonas sp. A25]BBN83795.1 two-component system sensor histidine kinase PmrB [Pseudoalteromonas sp. A25]
MLNNVNAQKQKARLSISRRLTMILLSGVILTAFMALMNGYQRSMDEAQKQLDIQLMNMANVLIVTPVRHWPEQSDLFAQLWQQQSQIYSAKLLKNLSISALEQPGLATQNISGTRLRTFVLHKDDKRLMVAEPIHKRFMLSESLILSAMTPLVLAMPLLAIFIAWYIRKALRPLRTLSNELKERQANDFTKLEIVSEDAEVAPVIERLNSLFAKVEKAYLRERYFASDAAHELKTPISSLKINLHNLSDDIQHSSLKAMQQGIEQLNHIVEQMLTLARTEPDRWRTNFHPVDITELSQNVVAQLYERIDQKHIQISLDAQQYWLRGCEFTLNTLFINLLSNAVKYTPNDGYVKLSITCLDCKILWAVEDSGPGMDDTQIARIFDRFYRVGGDKHPSGEKGAGLGMAIVQQIAEIYGASVGFERSQLGGLKVKIEFPKEHTCE